MTDAAKELEDMILSRLWARGQASVADLRSDLAAEMRERAWSHADILACLRHMGRKGWVDREQRGRGAVYTARLNARTARHHALGQLLSKAGEESGLLGSFVIRDIDLDPQDLADLKAERAEKARRQAESTAKAQSGPNTQATPKTRS